LAISITLLLTILVGGNLRSLYEGLLFLYQGITWDPAAIERIDRSGLYDLCYALVAQTNAKREQIIIDALRELELEPTLVPVPESAQANILVALGGQEPYTLFVAHYDKSSDDPAYQGASDNTAAVCALLEAITRLAGEGQTHAVAFLFTSAEEQGLRGSQSFITWMAVHGFRVREVINLDMIGRGRLASRPSAWPGLYFWVPGLGQMVYDGRRVWRADAYAQPNAQLIADVRRHLGRDLVIYRRFTAQSDSNTFEEAGLPTVSLSSHNMYYLNLVWESDRDRIELLDARNLELTASFVVDYARARQRLP
jgi:Zn-dependent M28 family amino/carboxypeptidase